MNKARTVIPMVIELIGALFALLFIAAVVAVAALTVSWWFAALLLFVLVWCAGSLIWNVTGSGREYRKEPME